MSEMNLQTVPKRAIECAHQLRKALLGPLEIEAKGLHDREAVVAAGRRDYRAAFGHDISAKTLIRLMHLVKARAGESKDLTPLEFYLPNTPEKRIRRPDFESVTKETPELREVLLSVCNASEPTENERTLIWLSACETWRTLNAAGLTTVRAQKLVTSAIESSGVAIARTRASLKQTFSRKLQRWIEEGYTVQAVRDRRSEASGNRRALPLTEADQGTLRAMALRGGLSQAWRQHHRSRAVSQEAANAFILNPASKSYVPHRVRSLIGPQVKLMEHIHRGPKQASNKGAWIERDWTSVSPGDWYQADDVTLPVYYWQENAQGEPECMRGQCLLMIDCRSLKILTLALHSERNYTAKTIRGLILKTHDAYGLPRKGFAFENGTWASAKLLKGVATADEVPADETEVGLREWVTFRHTLPGNPAAKVVERVIGLVQQRLEGVPGYCGRNEQIEKFERLQKQLLAASAGRKHPREFLHHRDQWVGLLTKICDEYNNDPQDGKLCAGLSPNEVFHEPAMALDPLVRLSPETRFLLSNHRRPLKVRLNGLCIQIGKCRHWFRNEATGGLIGQTVQTYFDPEDMSSVFIKIRSTDSTAIVVPAAPVPHATEATPEEHHLASASVAAQNRPARTLYAETERHFKAPTVPYRQVVSDSSTLELGAQIAEDQAQIREEQQSQAKTRRVIARAERRFGAKRSEPISDARKLQGYSLLQEAEHDANS